LDGKLKRQGENPKISRGCPGGKEERDNKRMD